MKYAKSLLIVICLSSIQLSFGVTVMTREEIISSVIHVVNSELESDTPAASPSAEESIQYTYDVATCSNFSLSLLVSGLEAIECISVDRKRKYRAYSGEYYSEMGVIDPGYKGLTIGAHAGASLLILKLPTSELQESNIYRTYKTVLSSEDTSGHKMGGAFKLIGGQVGFYNGNENGWAILVGYLAGLSAEIVSSSFNVEVKKRAVLQ